LIITGGQHLSLKIRTSRAECAKALRIATHEGRSGVDFSKATVRHIAPYEDSRYQQPLEQHHYLGAMPKIGRSLRYVAQRDGARGRC
jgi:hypothetical protein